MTVEDILHQHNLKSTGCRKLILSELLESRTALAESEMKVSYPGLFDRVTFYRTLKTLEDAGAIHKIVLQDNTTKYAISRHLGHEQDIHSHFHCGKCDEVFCLQNKIRLDIELPQGFVRHNISMVVEGLCAACN
ncbi:MAG: transcriptional repressor [Bacteroidia bacterium]|nr:transcriptional repressor [Bacteroidia bacterium]